ncbi:MAG: hypothetical protein MUO82_02225 [Candidatus Thermoplasmatota archaeon]|nr:hypothetical protein [Candidatus Thermoplasmatota archaeon]
MNKKIVGILICMLFIGTSFLTSIKGEITSNECDYYLNTTDTTNKCTMIKPRVLTSFATDVDPCGGYATLNGDLFFFWDSDYCDVWFVWDTSFHNSFEDYLLRTPTIRKYETGWFSATLNSRNINRGHTYYFRAVAYDGKNYDQGVNLCFTPGYPYIETRDASNISKTKARLNGLVSDTGCVDCDVWFVYDTSSHNSTSDYKYKTPSQHINNNGDVSYEITNLLQNTKYYFRAVISNDVGTYAGFEYDFITNNPPNIPSNPYPEMGATYIPIDIQISWISDDPDGDPVTYDIYLGEEILKKIQSNITTNKFSPEGLEYYKFYFWRIVAWDSDGVSSYGPIWSFFTKPDIRPPKPPSITGPDKGTIDIATDYNFMTRDPEGSDVYYFIDWGDNTNSGWIGPYESGDQNEITKSHTWSIKGTYNVKAKAKDIAGHESDWGTLKVKMPVSINIPFYQLIEKLFERFPQVFPILRQLRGY